MMLLSKWPVFYFVCLVMSSTLLLANEIATDPSKENALKTFIMSLAETQKAIPEDRRKLLEDAATKIRSTQTDRGSVELVFVCTHNSRRSQLAQIWAAIAAEQVGLKSVHSFSCGTEATACNARTIAALERAGLEFNKTGFNKTDDDTNPVYQLVDDIRLTNDNRSSKVELFSKAFDHSSLPKDGFIAMMCCDHADKNCPVVQGASQRISLWYVDPKVSDDRPDEAIVYDERCRQIAAEMFLLMQYVAKDRF